MCINYRLPFQTPVCMYIYNNIVIIVEYPEFILFWFYQTLKLSLGRAGVT